MSAPHLRTVSANATVLNKARRQADLARLRSAETRTEVIFWSLAPASQV